MEREMRNETDFSSNPLFKEATDNQLSHDSG